MTAVAVCIKWVAARPDVDAVTGVVRAETRAGGASAADEAALEWALRLAEQRGLESLVVSAGPEVAEEPLRRALACGATRAVRVDLPAGASSDIVAASLAEVVSGCPYVWCGDHSLDRGSGSVPVYLAARLGAAQALGLVHVELRDRTVDAIRRLDGGRRENLTIAPPAVVSVEGATASLRRASLAATIASGRAVIERCTGPAVGEHPSRPTRPFRPRPRSLAAPAGDSALERIASLLKASAPAGRSDPVTLEPAEAVDRILQALRDWGELGPP